VPTLTQRYDPAVPLDQLTEHPANPRRGDVSVIGESITEHGFYGAVLVQTSTGRIIAGNHRTRAARERGEPTVPVLFVDVDDDEAARILLVDNRSADLATNDDRALADLLGQLEEQANKLVGTGYEPADLAQLLALLEPPTMDEDEMRDFGRSGEHECPFCHARWVDTPEGAVPVEP
jgi:ParB-like chromosome segregation protein Spo0J